MLSRRRTRNFHCYGYFSLCTDNRPAWLAHCSYLWIIELNFGTVKLEQKCNKIELLKYTNNEHSSNSASQTFICNWNSYEYFFFFLFLPLGFPKRLFSSQKQREKENSKRSRLERKEKEEEDEEKERQVPPSLSSIVSKTRIS